MVPTVTVIEFEEPRHDDPELSYTVACDACGEQGNYDTYQKAWVARTKHAGEHIVAEVGPA